MCILRLKWLKIDGCMHPQLKINGCSCALCTCYYEDPTLFSKVIIRCLGLWPYYLENLSYGKVLSNFSNLRNSFCRRGKYRPLHVNRKKVESWILLKKFSEKLNLQSNQTPWKNLSVWKSKDTLVSITIRLIYRTHWKLMKRNLEPIWALSWVVQ